MPSVSRWRMSEMFMWPQLEEQSVTGTYPPSSLLWIKTDIRTTPMHSYLDLASTFSHACCLLGAFLQCHEMSKPV